jgi:hypothetical protein
MATIQRDIAPDCLIRSSSQSWSTTQPPNQPKTEVMKMMQTMKQRAKSEVTPIPTIYEEELKREEKIINSYFIS